MADTLTTIIELQGVATAVSQLQQLGREAATAAGGLSRLAQEAANIGKAFRGSESGLMRGFEGPASTLKALQATVPEAGKLAQVYEILGARAGGLSRTFGALGETIGLQPAMWLAVAGGIAIAGRAIQQVARFMSEGMRIADAYNQSLTRALVLFGNAGRMTTAGQLASLGRSRMAFGFSEQSTLDLAGQMAERGFSPNRINSLLPALQNIESGSAGRTSAESAMQMFLRVLERPAGMGGRTGGSSRGLLGIASQLGINIRFTGSIERDLNNLTDAINQKFGGVASALANTSSGVHLRLQESLNAEMGRLGALIEAGLTPAMMALNYTLQGFIKNDDRLLHGDAKGNRDDTAAFWAILRNPLLLFALPGIDAQRERERTLAKAGLPADQAWKDDIHQIALNTNRTASLIAQTVFGNISSFTRGSLSFANLNAAISVRA